MDVNLYGWKPIVNKNASSKGRDMDMRYYKPFSFKRKGRRVCGIRLRPWYQCVFIWIGIHLFGRHGMGADRDIDDVSNTGGSNGSQS